VMDALSELRKPRYPGEGFAADGGFVGQLPRAQLGFEVLAEGAPRRPRARHRITPHAPRTPACPSGRGSAHSNITRTRGDCHQLSQIGSARPGRSNVSASWSAATG
jgi:hypothetical protein